MARRSTFRLAACLAGPKAQVPAHGPSAASGRLTRASRRPGISRNARSGHRDPRSGHGLMVSVERQRVF